MARPTDYRPEYCEIVRDHLAQGYSLTTACGILGCNKASLYRWMDKHPEFSDAVEYGRALGQAKYEDILRGQADGTGNGNTSALTFAMRNLYPADYMDKQTVDHRHAHAHVQIDAPDKRQVARAVLSLLGDSQDIMPLLDVSPSTETHRQTPNDVDDIQ